MSAVVITRGLYFNEIHLSLNHTTFLASIHVNVTAPASDQLETDYGTVNTQVSVWS
jgi:hypothetical protein